MAAAPHHLQGTHVSFRAGLSSSKDVRVERRGAHGVKEPRGSGIAKRPARRLVASIVARDLATRRAHDSLLSTSERRGGRKERVQERADERDRAMHLLRRVSKDEREKAGA